MKYVFFLIKVIFFMYVNVMLSVLLLSIQLTRFLSLRVDLSSL